MRAAVRSFSPVIVRLLKFLVWKTGLKSRFEWGMVADITSP